MLRAENYDPCVWLIGIVGFEVRRGLTKSLWRSHSLSQQTYYLHVHILAWCYIVFTDSLRHGTVLITSFKSCCFGFKAINRLVVINRIIFYQDWRRGFFNQLIFYLVFRDRCVWRETWKDSWSLKEDLLFLVSVSPVCVSISYMCHLFASGPVLKTVRMAETLTKVNQIKRSLK